MQVGRILYESARRWPGRPALVGDGPPLTYRQWNAAVNRVAHGLAGLGIGKGDRVAAFAMNSSALMTLALALQKLGAVYVPTNFRLAAEELRFILQDAEVAALAYDGELAEIALAAAEGLDRLLVLTGDGPGQRLDDVAAGAADSEPAVTIDPSDLSLLMYTSGTTGRPKGVRLDHRAQWINTLLCALELGIRGDDRSLHMAPLYHVAAYHVMFLPHLLVGACNVVLRRFSPAAVRAALDEHRITTLLGVPTQYDRIAAQLPDCTPPANLRLAVTTGAPIARRTADWVRRHLTPGLYGVYGLTESTSLLTIFPPSQWDCRPDGCLGRALVGAEIRVLAVDPPLDLDRPAGRGEPGVLAGRTSKLMQGYLNRPEKTAETLRGDWLVTGDVVIEDEDGYFTLVDRFDDMIVSGGENIYPQEVERVLLQHPGVADCAVIGIADPAWGQAVKAFVVPRAPGLTAEALDAFCLDGRLARFKRPRQVAFVDEIPRNPSGKILRRELRARHDGADTKG